MKKYLSVLYFAYSIIPVLLGAHPDLIKSFKIIKKNKIVVKANKSFSKKFIKENFFAEYDRSIDLTTLDESVVTIPFILSIIPIVWVCNKSYSIDVMDKDLYHSLQEVKKVFRIFYPEQKWAGELVPKRLVTNTITPSTTPDEPVFGLLFSGGLDCVDSSVSYSDTKQLLITVWGSDVLLRQKNMWSCVYQKCEQFARDYGHEHAFVKSNFKPFIEEGGRTQKRLANKLQKIPNLWRMYTSTALAYIGLTAPILAVNNVSRILIASSHTVRYPFPLGSHPALDNNIAFAGISVFHDAADKDRVQKVMNVNAVCKEKNLSLPKLRVCWNKDPLGGNCLKCEKCIRTCTNIIAAGQRPQEYGFNINVSEAIKRAKLFFKKSGYMRKGLLMLWQCNLLYLDELTEGAKTNKLSDQEIQSFREFLYSIDFEGLVDPNALFTYSSERQKQFELIWKEHSKEVLDSLINS